jgi:hypothetical protein
LAGARADLFKEDAQNETSMNDRFEERLTFPSYACLASAFDCGEDFADSRGLSYITDREIDP